MKPKAMVAERYERRGILAIHPSAFFDLFFVGAEVPANRVEGDATIVSIRGPLDQHAESYRDSYEAILGRVAAACADQPPAIVLCLDSPGGDAQGALECAREIRAMCDAAGKQLISYVEGKACSAAYALACVAQKLIMAPTATVGSIGVLAARPDVSERNASNGVRVNFIGSGERKADGHPESPATADELASMQSVIDSIAAVFFELVAEMRGLTVEAVAGLEAAVFHGDAARAAGIGDETLTFKATLASLASWKETAAMTIKAESGDDKDKDKKPDGDGDESYDSLRAKLKKMASGDDANAKAAARALAALESSGDEEEPQAEGGDKPAEGGDDKKPEEKAAAKALGLALKAQTEVHNLRAELAAERETARRDKLIASRPDLSKEMVALLAQCPLKLVEETLSKLEPAGDAEGDKSSKGPGTGVSASEALAALQAGVKPTPGQNDGGRPGALPPAEKAWLDERFGLRPAASAPKAGNIDASSPHKLVLGGAVHAPPQPKGAA
jgi:ClpP class serine protease